MGTMKKKESFIAQRDQSPKRWKTAFTRAMQVIAAERRQSIGEGKLTSFADVVQAAATFDRNGHIRMEFEDDDKYNISTLQEQTKKNEDESPQAARHKSNQGNIDVPR